MLKNNNEKITIYNTTDLRIRVKGKQIIKIFINKKADNNCCT